MSSKTVEHFVLFSVKPNLNPSTVDATISSLNSLTSLSLVQYLAVGPISQSRSHPFNFTHLVHGRFKSKEDFNAYAAHPAHRSVAKRSFLPVCNDFLIADWISDIDGPIVPRPDYTVRIVLLKLKEGVTDQDKRKILSVLGEIGRSLPDIHQVSVGENFSTVGTKGFTVGSVLIFSGLKMIDALDVTVEMKKSDEARFLLDSIVVDYEIPPLALSRL